MVEEGFDIFRRWRLILSSADLEDVLDLLRAAALYEVMRVGYDPFVKADEGLLRKMVRSGLVRKTKSGYSLTEYGLLFLSIFSMLVAELGLYEDTPPSRKTLEMVERLLRFAELYELSGVKAENVVVISNLLGRLADLTALVPVLDTDGVKRLMEKISALREALVEVGSQWREEIMALDAVLDADFSVIGGNIDGFETLFNRLMRVSLVPSAVADAVIGRLLDGGISPWEIFDWNLVPLRVYPLAPLSVRYKADRAESKGVPPFTGKRAVVLPSASEIFGVLSSMVQRGIVPDLSEDGWWLNALSHYKDAYNRLGDTEGYRKALKARKLMAVSMVFEGLGEELPQEVRQRLWLAFGRLANLV